MKNYNDLVKLIADVNAHNTIATDCEAVCDMQDMIAHSSEEQLTELANDDKTRFAFYWIYSIAYRVDSVLTFYAKHDDRIYNLRLENATLKNDLDEAKELLTYTKDDLSAARKATIEEHKKNIALDRENHELKAEIIELKAKLYDLMTK